MTTRKWFELIDERGQTGVTDVTADDNETIVRFRKRVKTESPNTLAHVAPSKLIVYANRAAFDAKQAPLEEHAPIGEHGNPEGPLVAVVAPQQQSNVAVNSRSHALRTRVDAWFGNDTLSSAEMKRPKSSGGEVDFQTTRYLEMTLLPPLAHPMVRFKEIMERKANVVIFGELMDRTKPILEKHWNVNMIVTGTEGTDLSRFYVYAAYQLIFQHHEKAKSLPSFDLVLNFRDTYHKYCASTKELTLLTADGVYDISLEDRVLRLIEGESSLLVGWRGVSILFAAVGLPDMHSYAKVDSYTYVLPVWMLDELQALNAILRDDLQLPEDVLSERYYRYGGIPRLIFMAMIRENEGAYKRAIN
ncbi:hypothetical protein FI667_g10745, partial [Globisporangium splendens]